MKEVPDLVYGPAESLPVQAAVGEEGHSCHVGEVFRAGVADAVEVDMIGHGIRAGGWFGEESLLHAQACLQVDLPA